MKRLSFPECLMTSLSPDFDLNSVTAEQWCDIIFCRKDRGLQPFNKLLNKWQMFFSLKNVLALKCYMPSAWERTWKYCDKIYKIMVKLWRGANRSHGVISMFAGVVAAIIPLWTEFPVFWEFLRIPWDSQKFPTMQISSDLKSLELLGISGKGRLQFCEDFEFLGILSYTNYL